MGVCLGHFLLKTWGFEIFNPTVPLERGLSQNIVTFFAFFAFSSPLLGPPTPWILRWKHFGLSLVEMWRIFREISYGFISWKIKSENLQKFSPKLHCISPEFRSGIIFLFLGQEQTAAIYWENSEFHSDPVCTTPVQKFDHPGCWALSASSRICTARFE